jgi:hypothetical protein
MHGREGLEKPEQRFAVRQRLGQQVELRLVNCRRLVGNYHDWPCATISPPSFSRRTPRALDASRLSARPRPPAAALPQDLDLQRASLLMEPKLGSASLEPERLPASQREPIKLGLPLRVPRLQSRILRLLRLRLRLQGRNLNGEQTILGYRSIYYHTNTHVYHERLKSSCIDPQKYFL